MPSRDPASKAAALLTTAGTVSAGVIAARILAFSTPDSLSPWHQAEAQRMVSEKLEAVRDGMHAASIELAMLPTRALMIAARPSSWTAGGWMQAWTDTAGLWIGLGNAALRPATAAATRNRARLARRRT